MAIGRSAGWALPRGRGRRRRSVRRLVGVAWARRGAFVGVAVRGQTYRNALYLLLALPLGAVYVGLLLPPLMFGLASLVVVIGAPVLLVTMVVGWALGTFERRLAHALLGVEIPPPIRPAHLPLNRRERLSAYLHDQVTWTNLLYLLAKLPLGACTCLAMVGAALATVGTGVVGLRQVAGAAGPGAVLVRVALAAVATGLVALVGLHVLNYLAFLSGRFARVMLGPSEAALRLAASEAAERRARAAAERAEQSRRELIVNVSHELRTPTASIRGHVESLLMALGPPLTGAEAETEPLLPPANLRGYLGIIQREAERLGALVDDLLTLARSEAGELRLTLGPVDAATVVAEVHQTLAPLAWRERSVTVVQECAPGLPLVLADRARLAQVLLNLIRNAVTHTPPGGIVSLALGPAADGTARVALRVADTGSGIPPEDLARIFERFYRVDASRSRDSGGFGLGLAIVKDLVAAMGGEVTVESRLGEGSCFSVLLQTDRRADGQTDRETKTDGQTDGQR